MTTYAAVLRGGHGAAMVEGATRILDGGFEGIGLEHPLYWREWESLQGALPRDRLCSIQLFLPYPRGLRAGEACPFALGSTHAEAKRDAVKYGLETIEFAARHAIPVVLLPLVRLEETPGRERRHQGSQPPNREQAGTLKEPRRAVQKELDAFLSVVAKLLEGASRRGITLGITPGGPANELPNLEEGAACLAEFRGAPLGFWPDTARWARASLLHPGQDSSWDALREHGLGVTLRDVKGLDNGSAPPLLGEGDLDWKSLEPLLGSCPVWLADPPASPAAEVLARSLGFLQETAGQLAHKKAPASRKDAPGLLDF